MVNILVKHSLQDDTTDQSKAKTPLQKARNKVSEGPKAEDRNRAKLKKFLLAKADVRLSDDGMGVKCLLCRKTPKLDKSKRTAKVQLKYFSCVHICSTIKRTQLVHIIIVCLSPDFPWAGISLTFHSWD